MEVSARRDGTLWAHRRPPFHGGTWSRRALVGHGLFADHRWLGFFPSRGPLNAKWGRGLIRTYGVGIGEGYPEQDGQLAFFRCAKAASSLGAHWAPPSRSP